MRRVYGALATRRFGRSGLALTTLGLGGVPLAGLYAPIGDDAALDTVLAAHAYGIRYCDTAPYHGHGLSEHRLGQALRRLPRAAFRLSTKVRRRLRAAPAETVEGRCSPKCPSSTTATTARCARSRTACSASASPASIWCWCTIPTGAGTATPGTSVPRGHGGRAPRSSACAARA